MPPHCRLVRKHELALCTLDVHRPAVVNQLDVLEEAGLGAEVLAAPLALVVVRRDQTGLALVVSFVAEKKIMLGK